MRSMLALVILWGCVGESKPDSESGSTGALQWYATCGDPSCQGYTGPYEGVPECSTEAEGAACTSAGASCDFHDECNRVLLCTDEDPTQQEGGCPISRARFKTGIRYLDRAERDALADELLRTRLARYRYKSADPTGPERLGFIIDDQPTSAAVAPDGDHVDLYAYTSETVATLQRQQEQIAALQAQVAALAATVEALRRGPPAPLSDISSAP